MYEQLIKELGTDYIQTYKGLLWINDPKEEHIDIETIAHALSNLCRFGGHCKEFYSVAQHCFLGSYYVDPQQALAFLLHDASEAYIVDLVRPVKRLLPAYLDIENKIQTVINKKYKINTHTSEIKLIDNRMLVTEAEQLLNNVYEWHKEPHWPKPLDITLYPWSAENAKANFLIRFNELYDGPKYQFT